MADKLQRVLDGEIGKFWHFDNSFSRLANEFHCHVRKIDNATVELTDCAQIPIPHPLYGGRPHSPSNWSRSEHSRTLPTHAALGWNGSHKARSRPPREWQGKRLHN